MKLTKKLPAIPTYLSKTTRQWCRGILTAWELEEHHLKILYGAGKAWDRAAEARTAIDRLGLTFEDRFGQVRPRPEVQMERDSMTLFARLMRELNLDSEVIPDPKPPKIGGK
jgi:hypothetical protein